jgi:solute:Na+ symporter, SSS family
MLAVVVTTVFMLPYFALQIAGMGKLLSTVSDGDISYWVGAGLMLVIMLIYSLIAGLRADVWTDVIQGLLMLVVMVTVSVGFLTIEWDGSLTAMFQEIVQAGKSALLSIPGPSGYFTYQMLISFLVFFLLVPITQPQLNIRLYAARSERELVHTMFIFPILVLLMFIPSAIIGLGGAAKFTVTQVI